jgi:predicted O-linked N-acetylglucosamine transferase (SPINDLY family)
VRLPELVTHSIEDYEALALRLAKDPSLLQRYRNQLANNRLTHPLFDTERFRPHRGSLSADVADLAAGRATEKLCSRGGMAG